MNYLITTPSTAFPEEKTAIFIILPFIWSPWDIFNVQRIDKRHFIFHSKSKTMKGNIFPKLPADVYFYLKVKQFH